LNILKGEEAAAGVREERQNEVVWEEIRDVNEAGFVVKS